MRRIQMGGGRKKSGKKYYFLKDQKQRYCIQSDNLELVTILECISAAGDVVPPLFCLQNGATPDLRELSDNEWGRFEGLILFLMLDVLTLRHLSIYFLESGWTDSFNAERWLASTTPAILTSPTPADNGLKPSRPHRLQLTTDLNHPDLANSS